MLPSSDIIRLQFHIIFSPFLAARYHSLVIEKESFPDEELEVTAWNEDGLIMAVRHKKYRHMQVTIYSSCCTDLS
jgi:anthranilate/para-aminobenzoate synthase component II